MPVAVGFLAVGFLTCGFLAGGLACNTPQSQAAGGASPGSTSTSTTSGAGAGPSTSSGAGGCGAGFADCNGDPADGCEVDTSTAPSSCGRCGHDCLGGACVAGACQPVTLATGQATPTLITADDTSLYFTSFVYANAGAVLKLAKSGGPTTVLASGQTLPRAIAIDASDVYWANTGTEAPNAADGAIMKVPLGGGTPTVVASGQASPALIALDASNVYWTTYYGGTVMRAPKAGGPSETLVSGQQRPTGIAVDDTHLYFATTPSFLDGQVFSMPLAGGPPTSLAQGEHDPVYIALDGQRIYWLTSLELRARSLTAPTPTATLAPTGGIPTVVVVDATAAYFTSGFDASSGSVWKVPLNGAPPVVLATGQDKPAGLVADASTLYWCNAGSGTIMKLAK